MKTLSFLLFFLCASLAAAQTVPSSCDAPDSVKDLYRGDAAWSAIIKPDYRYHQFFPEFEDSIEIPLARADSILHAIIAVKNALPSFPNEMAVYIDSVHHFSSKALQEMYLEVDTSYEWCSRLVNKQLPTGNTVFDSLYNVYGMTVRFNGEYSDQGTATIFINTVGYYNTNALAHTIAKLSGVIFGEWLPLYYEKHYLVVGRNDSLYKVLFSYGWDGCRPYCRYRHFWVFTVFPNCSVKLDTSYGDALPVLSVNSLAKTENLLSLYPNPVTDKLIIEAEERGTAIISDISGKEVQTATLTDGKNEVVVRELASRMYFITLRSRDGSVRTGQFIKR